MTGNDRPSVTHSSLPVLVIWGQCQSSVISGKANVNNDLERSKQTLVMERDMAPTVATDVAECGPWDNLAFC